MLASEQQARRPAGRRAYQHAKCTPEAAIQRAARAGVTRTRVGMAAARLWKVEKGPARDRGYGEAKTGRPAQMGARWKAGGTTLPPAASGQTAGGAAGCRSGAPGPKAMPSSRVVLEKLHGEPVERDRGDGDGHRQRHQQLRGLRGRGRGTGGHAFKSRGITAVMHGPARQACCRFPLKRQHSHEREPLPRSSHTLSYSDAWPPHHIPTPKHQSAHPVVPVLLHSREPRVRQRRQQRCHLHKLRVSW